MRGEVKIERVTPGDIEAIAALAGEIWRRHYADIIGGYVMDDYIMVKKECT